MTISKLEHMINPQVLTAFLSTKLTDAIKFAPLADVSTELMGQPGNTLTMPTWKYIGNANDLPEGESDVPVILQATSSQVKVKKAVKSVEISDEAVLSGYGNPMEQIGRQLLQAISSKVDTDIVEALGKVDEKRKFDAKKALDKDVIADAVVMFGEDLDEDMFLFVSPAQYSELRKDKDFVYIDNGQAKITGQVGMLYGVNIIISNKINDKKGNVENFLVKRGAFGIELKRAVEVETDRDVLKKTTVVSADEHYVAYVKDESRVVKIACTKPSTEVGAGLGH